MREKVRKKKRKNILFLKTEMKNYIMKIPLIIFHLFCLLRTHIWSIQSNTLMYGPHMPIIYLSIQPSPIPYIAILTLKSFYFVNKQFALALTLFLLLRPSFLLLLFRLIIIFQYYFFNSYIYIFFKLGYWGEGTAKQLNSK
jgi:hypothetical protein